MVGLVKPEVDRHISKNGEKTEKSIELLKLRHFKNILTWIRMTFKMP